MKYFVLVSAFFLFNSISYGQEVLNSDFDTITFGNPLRKVLNKYVSKVHKQSKRQALIYLTLNQLDEHKQTYRISTFRSKDAIGLCSIMRYDKIGNDIIFFSISYNQQLLKYLDLNVEKVLESIESTTLCKSDEYWEVVIINDKSYRINTKARGHQTYRHGKIIRFFPPKK